MNPQIHDFTAFDFWMRPCGTQRVAGQLGDACDLVWFDFLVANKRDVWGRGRSPEQVVATRAAFGDLRRRFRRFGRPRKEFREFLTRQSVDVALIPTGRAYGYLGVREVIGDVRDEMYHTSALEKAILGQSKEIGEHHESDRIRRFAGRGRIAGLYGGL